MANRNDEERNRGGWSGRDRDEERGSGSTGGGWFGRNRDEERGSGGWFGRDRENEPGRGTYGGREREWSPGQREDWRGGGWGQGSETYGSQGSGYGYQGGYGSYSSTAGVGGQSGGYGVANQGQGGYGSYGNTTAGYGGQFGRESWEGPHSGRGPQGYQRSNDSIREEVCERLTRHGHIDASGVQVNIENGEVTLEGTVKTRREKRLAEDILESVSGVRDVHNRLRIESGEHNGRDKQQSQAATETEPRGRRK